MTEPYSDTADRRPVQPHEGVPADPRTVPGLENPNYATTDVDPTPDAPRPFAAAEPNYATTDIDPTPGSPRPFAAAEPNYATTDIDPTPGSPRPLAATEPNYATTDVDPTRGSAPGGDVHGVPGGVVADPAVGTGRPDTRPLRGR